MRSIFFAPHSDDECLFGAFTLLKYQPTVVICFPSSGDYGSTEERFQESVAACMNLGVSDIRQWVKRGADAAEDKRILMEQMLAIVAELQPDCVWVPSPQCSHIDHDTVNSAATGLNTMVHWYSTYTMTGDEAFKERETPPLVVDDPKWIAIKHFALTKYQSQINHPRARQFFLMDLNEYAEQP